MLVKIKNWDQYIYFLDTIDKRCTAYKNRRDIEQWLLNNAKRGDGYKQWRKREPSVIKRYQRNSVLNQKINRFHKHHLHLDQSRSFVIYIPSWLHSIYHHNPHTWDGMDSINAIALDYWINEDIYEW